MELLIYLAVHQGRVISADELLNNLWAGKVVTESTVYNTVAELRNVLADDQDARPYVENIPKKGYRLVAPVESAQREHGLSGHELKKKRFAAASVAVLILTAVASWLLLGNLVWQSPIDPVRADAIAVLPFVNRSASEDDMYFVDGIHDDILTSLAKIGSLKVISRTSVEQYRDTKKTVKQIGAELGVNTILEGGIMRSGDKIRINVQLIDVDTDAYLWAESYERALTATNIFAIQKDVSNAIAVALRTTLSPIERVRIADVATESLEAYEAYLLGKNQLKKRTGDSIEKAVGYFQEAIDLDPDFALAHSGLADSYQLLRGYASEPWDELRPQAAVAAKRAIELDPNLGEAYASLAMIHFESGEYDLAGPLLVRALELYPNYATGHQWYGEFLQRTGQGEAALAHLQIAVRIDPLSPIINHTLAYQLRHVGRFTEAETRFKKAIEVDPYFARAYHGLAVLYFSDLGRLDDAAINAHKACRLNPRNATNFALLAHILLHLGDYDAAERWLNEAIRLNPADWSTNRVRSTMALSRGRRAEAAEIARVMLSGNPRQSWFVSLLSDNYVRPGRVADALSLFETGYPELMTESGPEVTQDNAVMAIVLARLYQETGEIERANELLERAQEVYIASRKVVRNIRNLVDVRLYAVMGEKEKALDALRSAINSGWRYLHFYYFGGEITLDSIRDEPEFVAMAAEVNADLKRQRESLKDKWAAELDPIKQ